jgi:hypothetical protein
MDPYECKSFVNPFSLKKFVANDYLPRAIGIHIDHLECFQVCSTIHSPVTAKPQFNLAMRDQFVSRQRDNRRCILLVLHLDVIRHA